MSVFFSDSVLNTYCFFSASVVFSLNSLSLFGMEAKESVISILRGILKRASLFVSLSVSMPADGHDHTITAGASPSLPDTLKLHFSLNS